MPGDITRFVAGEKNDCSRNLGVPSHSPQGNPRDQFLFYLIRQRVGHGPADELQELFPKGPPELPADLKMAQMAQLSDVLAYVHDQLALVVDMAVEDRQGNLSQMRVDRDSWQKLLKLAFPFLVAKKHARKHPTLRVSVTEVTGRTTRLSASL